MEAKRPSFASSRVPYFSLQMSAVFKVLRGDSTVVLSKQSSLRLIPGIIPSHVSCGNPDMLVALLNLSQSDEEETWKALSLLRLFGVPGG